MGTDSEPHDHQSLAIPAGHVLARCTPEFDESSIPAGLLAVHRVAAGVWGRLVVRSGSIGFRFEDGGGVRTIAAGDVQVIPPERPHRVVVTGPVRFVVEFHRPGVRLKP